MNDNSYIWPEPDAVVARLAAFMEERGEELVIVRADDLLAGFNRARSVLDYEPEATAGKLAAVMFDGIATRHPLLDGNKRLALLAALTFLFMNDVYLDVGEERLFELCYAIVAKEQPLEALSDLIEREGRPVFGSEDQ